MNLTDFIGNEGNNKDLLLTFDNKVKREMTLTNDKSPGDLSLEPSLPSSSLKIEVKSYYSKSANGFAAIRIWTSGK